MLKIQTLIELKSGGKILYFTMGTKNVIILLLLALQLASLLHCIAAVPFEVIYKEREENGFRPFQFAATNDITEEKREKNGFDQSGDKSWATDFTNDNLIIYVNTENFNGPIYETKPTEEELDQHRVEIAVRVIQKTNEMRLPLKSGSISILHDNTLDKKAIRFNFAFEDWFVILKKFWSQQGKQLTSESGFIYQVDRNLQNMLDRNTELVDTETYFYAYHFVSNEPDQTRGESCSFMTQAMTGIILNPEYSARLLLPITLGAYKEIEDDQRWKCIFVFKMQSEVDILNNFIKGHLGALAHTMVENDTLKAKAAYMLRKTTVDTTEPRETTTSDKTHIRHDNEYVYISTVVDMSGIDDNENSWKTAAIVQAIENIKLKAGTKLLGDFSLVGIANETEANLLNFAVVLKYLTETDLLSEQEIQSSPVRGGSRSVYEPNTTLPTPLYEKDQEKSPKQVSFSSVNDYKQFITMIGCVFQQVISRQYFNSTNDFIGFYNYYKEEYAKINTDGVEKDILEPIFQEYRPKIQARQHTCVGLAYELRNRVNSFLPHNHPAIGQFYIVSSADEKPQQDAKDTGSVPPASNPGLITHVLLCLKVNLGGRDGFILLDPGYPIRFVLTVMKDEKFPHTGRFLHYQVTTGRTEYDYAMVSEDYITLKYITTTIVDGKGKEDPGNPTIDRYYIWHREPFKSGTDIAQRLLLPRSPKTLQRFDIQGRCVAGVRFSFTGNMETSMYYNVDGQRQNYTFDLKTSLKATAGKDTIEVDGASHIEKCGQDIGLEPGELREMMEKIGEVMRDNSFVEELLRLEEKIEEANKN